MTVLVNGASGVLGRAVVRALVGHDEVRATVRRPEAGDDLRGLGAKVAVRPVDEPDQLLEILPRVHTLLHLVGGVNQPTDEGILAANHGSAVAAVAAAKEAGTRRVVLVSVAGASIDAPHPFLRAKGLAEEVVVHSGLEHAVLRTSHVYGLGGLWFTATMTGADHGFVIGDGEQRSAPILAADVAAVVAAIDDRRDPVEGVWSLGGPDELTADDVVAIAGEGEAPAHLDPATAAERLTTLLGVPVSPRATEHWAAPSVADAPDAAAAFGVSTTRFADGLEAIAAEVARAG